MDWSLSRWVDPLLWPLLAIGVCLVARHRVLPTRERRARVLFAVAWAAWGFVWIASTPVVVDAFIGWLEVRAADPMTALDGVPTEKTAMVVLGAGLKTDAEDVPPRERLNEPATARILGAARLYAAHPTGVVVLSGGPRAVAEAALDLAVHEGIPRERIASEPKSANTYENAVESLSIVRARGADAKVIVVTSSTHMRRALRDFRRAGVEAIPAPVDPLRRNAHGPRALFPDAMAAERAYRVMHELLGMLKP